MNRFDGIILGIVVWIGIFYAIFFIPTILHDPSSTWLRFSQSFFNIWTVLPFGIIGFGGFIIGDALFRVQSREITYRLTLCGVLVILLGVSFFWLYIID